MTVTATKAPIQWTETAIRDGALKFLSDKNEQLNDCISLLKTATMENGDVHAQPTKLARERVCKLAIEAGKETNKLQRYAILYLDYHYRTDPESDETKYIAKIASAAQMGLSYFNDIAASSRPDYSSSLGVKFFKKINETSLWGIRLLSLPTVLSWIPGFPRFSLVAEQRTNITKCMIENPNLNVSSGRDIYSTCDFEMDAPNRIKQVAGIMLVSYAALVLTSILVTSCFPSSPLPTPAEIHLKHMAFSKALAPATN